MSKKISNIHLLTKVLLVIAVPFALVMINSSVSASQMQNRSVAISSATPGANIQNVFRFNVPSSDNVASISFEYCVNSPVLPIACIAPTGFNASGATLTGQTANIGFTYDGANSTSNRIIITRGSSPMNTVASSYTFSNVVNTTDPNRTIFVRISTHASADGTGPYIDDGSVAFSSGVTGFSVGTFVPPYLTFCVGVTVATNCSNTGDVLTSFGELSSNYTSTATTQFAVATNDYSGYNVYLQGQTLTSGNSVVNALSTSTGSSIGASQFGINLRNNSIPSVGANKDGVGTGNPTSDYNNPNSFKFGNGDIIARSTLSTQFNRFTVSYVVNVPNSQAPGVYATTLTYLAVATF